VNWAQAASSRQRGAMSLPEYENTLNNLRDKFKKKECLH